MAFIEHNNRNIANKHAEYITGKDLRLYVNEKVKKYLGDRAISVFDGAVGSGQLEQYVNVETLYGVDVQKLSCEAARENYPNSEIICESFFNYQNGGIKVDAVIMNPPFSLKYKDFSDEERANITKDFAWKKSGVVDDIFVLKSLTFTKRYGFYILFPGVGYRKTEKTFRKLIGNSLQELNIIENAFEDTQINVIFAVIDKEKNSNEIYKERYDCKLKKAVVIENGTLDFDEDYRWEQVGEVEVEEEKIDIDLLNERIRLSYIEQLRRNIELDLHLMKTFGAKVNIEDTLKQIKHICRFAEEELKTIRKT